MTFFEELKEKKDIILARGDIVNQAITRTESKDLVKNLLMFYLNNDLFDKYVYNFNQNS